MKTSEFKTSHLTVVSDVTVLFFFGHYYRENDFCLNPRSLIIA